MIKISGLTKIYPNGVRANDGVNLSAHRGEIVGIIGPNGAGKTTLIRQLLGLLKPTEGKIEVLGFDIGEEPNNARELIGYVPQMPLYYPALTTEEVIQFVLRFKGYKRGAIITKVRETLELVGLEPMAKLSGYQLSHGSMKLLLLAIAMCRNPAVLVLDEPTAMVDVTKKFRTWRLLRALKDKVILLASHDMYEVKELCDKVYFMAEGRIVARGPPDEITASIKLPVEIAFSPSDATEAEVESLLSAEKVPFEKEGTFFKVSFEELCEGIAFVERINKCFELGYLHLEAPNFEGAIEYLFGKSAQ
jgi:ABC-2 type transport system ATP-binding protein